MAATYTQSQRMELLSRRESKGPEKMADHVVPHYTNDDGVPTIDIGVKEFMCIGANPPFDHPHVYLDLGDDDEKVCPYCSTLYRYKPDLAATDTRPPGHLWQAAA
jgi:uncharacterized Zn-finger protein